MDSQQNTNPVLLVVDDEPEIREIIAFCAQDIGFRVLEAGDGGQALDVVRHEKVDIICSDLMMPRVTGITFLNTLRDEGFHQPFILLTAFPSQDTTIQALRLGAFDYIEKPFDSDDLKNLLREALRVTQVHQQSLKGLDTHLGADSSSVGEPSSSPQIRQALQVIHRLKALRYSQDGGGKNQDELRRVRELFVDEATPQLLFCEGAIKNLVHPESRAFELGYLFRVMQTIGQAAGAINESEIETFARSAEHFFTVLRIQPRHVDEALIDLAAQAAEMLRHAIALLGAEHLPEGWGDVKSQLQQHTERLTNQVAA